MREMALFIYKTSVGFVGKTEIFFPETEKRKFFFVGHMGKGMGVCGTSTTQML